jgi:hypothetical protein
MTPAVRVGALRQRRLNEADRSAEAKQPFAFSDILLIL